MVPANFLAEIKNGEPAEDAQGDDFLQNLELGDGIEGVSPAIGRDLEYVLKKSDAPARQYDQPKRRAFVFQMPVPRERHEQVGRRQQDDREPARLEEFSHS